jgi:hypothetical protein
VFGQGARSKIGEGVWIGDKRAIVTIMDVEEFKYIHENVLGISRK